SPDTECARTSCVCVKPAVPGSSIMWGNCSQQLQSLVNGQPPWY
ncbi:hypothetical protein HaLaN_10534, partial [Haematococcus lacustris]